MDATNSAAISQQERDKLILDWREAQAVAKRAVETERTLRAKIVETLFPQHKPEGTENYELGGGYKVKATFAYRYELPKGEKKADKPGLEATEDMLDEIAKTGEDGEFVAERLVKWEPVLSVSEYRKLDDAKKKIVDKVLTIKPASPTVELVEPK